MSDILKTLSICLINYICLKNTYKNICVNYKFLLHELIHE